MVDFAKLEINKEIITDIENIGNFYGVVRCYIIDLLR